MGFRHCRWSRSSSSSSSVPTDLHQAGSRCEPVSVSVVGINRPALLAETLSVQFSTTQKAFNFDHHPYPFCSVSEKNMANNVVSKNAAAPGVESFSFAFKCPQCPNGFHKSSNLMYHLFRAHNVRSEQNATCDACGMVCFNANGMMQWLPLSLHNIQMFDCFSSKQVLKLTKLNAVRNWAPLNHRKRSTT